MSDSYFLTLLCFVCFVHSSPPLLGHEAAPGSQGTEEGDTEDERPLWVQTVEQQGGPEVEGLLLLLLWGGVEGVEGEVRWSHKSA